MDASAKNSWTFQVIFSAIQVILVQYNNHANQIKEIERNASGKALLHGQEVPYFA